MTVSPSVTQWQCDSLFYKPDAKLRLRLLVLVSLSVGHRVENE